MPKHQNPRDLSLRLPDHPNAPSRPTSSPIALEGIDLSSIEGSFALSNLPPLPSSPPPNSLGHDRDPSKGALDGVLRDSSRERPQHSDQKDRTARQKDNDPDDPAAAADESLPPGSSGSMSKVYHLRKGPGSTQELSLVGSAESVSKPSVEVLPPPQTDSRSQPSPHHSEDSSASRRKDRHFRNPLARNKSTRRDSHSSKLKPNGARAYPSDAPPKTAPLSTDWPGSEMIKGKGKDRRGKSAERAPRTGSEDNLRTDLPLRQQPPPHQPVQPAQQYQQLPQHTVQHHLHPREREKTTFLSGGKNAFSKARFGGGNLLNRIGKMARSGSSNERDIIAYQPEEAYVPRVITLPLIEQTRMTRISKSLDDCKDKTEYWMPSLPWRCIDYLNLNVESEGLFRIPGSGPQIKQWQRRFDTELDINLLEEEELYDPNNISSLLKQWLRELPTEIFPPDLQTSLAVELEKDNADYTKMGQPAPQKLRDALSELSPFNYYLLFAITCHLSLLVSHQDKNRMDLNNLSICIGPCLRLERWLFNYLIGDWRHCWQGCWTEKQALEVERRLEDPDYVGESSSSSPEAGIAVTTAAPPIQDTDPDERAISSGGDSTASAASPEELRDGLRQQLPGTSSSSRYPSRDNSAGGSTSSRRQQQQLQSQNENAKPGVYVPLGMLSTQQQGQQLANGGLDPSDRRPATAHDQPRPSTADNRKGANGGTAAGSTAASAALAPRSQTHARNHSDVPSSPSSPG